MGKLEGKVAIVTGAASGIGRESALRFSDEGAAVMCADIDIDGAQHTAAMISEQNRPAAALELDVANRLAVKGALERTVAELGGLDIVYNNAGIGARTWEEVVAINLTGVYNGLYYGCRMLAERGGGTVISTASILGLVGSTPLPGTETATMEYGNGAYVASKGGVVQLTRQFAINYATRGVRVNAIAPGYIVTPMTAPIRESPEMEAHLISLHPMGRLGQADEIAAAATFLASNDASFITGVTLPVDGGYTAR